MYEFANDKALNKIHFFLTHLFANLSDLVKLPKSATDT